jgi:hypothetical protein
MANLQNPTTHEFWMDKNNTIWVITGGVFHLSYKKLTENLAKNIKKTPLFQCTSSRGFVLEKRIAKFSHINENCVPRLPCSQVWKTTVEWKP